MIGNFYPFPDAYLTFGGPTNRWWSIYAVLAYFAGMYGDVYSDLIQEETTDAGVTIDGVLCKDSVIPNSAYPNALLLDGLRAMTGTFNVGNQIIDKAKELQLYDPNIEPYGGRLRFYHKASSTYRMEKIDGSAIVLELYNTLKLQSFMGITGLTTFDQPSTIDYGQMRFRNLSYRGTTKFQHYNLAYSVLYDTLVTTVNLTSGLPQLDVGEDIMFGIGKDSDGSLPTPSSAYRGKMIRVEGGAGVVDKLYMCMKKADDSYDWIQVVSG